MNFLLIILTTFLVSCFITPFVKKIAININSVDNPNKRRVNTKPMPTLGGLSIFFGFIMGYVFFGQNSTEMIPILIGGIIIILVGVFDGIYSLKPFEKFIGQLIGALILVVYGNMVITFIDGFGIFIEFGMFSYPVTVLFVLFMINAVNFIDGLDGLATGLSLIFFVSFSILAYLTSGTNSIDYIFALIMIGSSLGFLVHNFYPATIYLGDSGSMFLGYIISAIAIMKFKNITLTSFIMPIIFIMIIPILDVVFAVFRRIRRKESIFVADKQHIHHQILNITKSHRRTVLVIYFIDILFAAASIFYILERSTIAIILYVVLAILTLIFIGSTTILSDKVFFKRFFKKKQ